MTKPLKRTFEENLLLQVNKKLSLQRAQKCKTLRGEGLSLRLISKQTGLSLGAVRFHTKEISVPVKESLKTVRNPDIISSNPLLPSEDFAYLLGIYFGDGCLTQMNNCVAFLVTCATKNHFYLIDRYKTLISKLTRLKVHERTKANNSLEVIVYSQKLPTILGLKVGKKSSSIIIPQWIFVQNTYIRPFLRGLIETDGSITSKISKNGGRSWTLSFTQENPSIMNSFLKCAEILGYKFSNKRGNRALLVGGVVVIKKFIEEMQLSERIIYYDYSL